MAAMASPDDASFSMEDFESALENYDYSFQKGQRVRGRPVSHDPDGVHVDVGGKSTAFLPRDEVSLKPIATDDLQAIAPLNEEIEFVIIREQNADGQVLLSLKELEVQRIMARLEEAEAEKQSLPVRVTGTNRGGVTVDVEGLRGFIPRSHLVERHDLNGLVGQTLSVTVLELDPTRKRLVFSNRLAVRSASLTQFELGQLVEGTVSNIRPFGIFVDLADGLTGLLHIKQVSQNYVDSLESLFQVGQPIKAMIADIDTAKSRISLSTKVLENFPGEMLEQTAEVMAEAENRQGRARKAILEL